MSLQPTLRASRNSPAVRQFTIHTWDQLVEERRAGMRAVIAMLAAGKLLICADVTLPISALFLQTRVNAIVYQR